MDNEMIGYVFSASFISGVMLGIEIYTKDTADDETLRWGIVLDLLIVRLNFSVHDVPPVKPA